MSLPNFTMSYFDYLPDELYEEIFAKLKQRDLCSASLVCKKWRDIARDPHLWKSLTFHNCGHEEPVLNMIEHCHLVKEMVFERVDYWHFMYCFPDCIYLKKLVFNSCDITADQMSIIVDNVPEIVSVDVSDFDYDYEMVDEILQWRKLKNVSITINRDHFDANDAVLHLSEIQFGVLANLEKFDFNFDGYIYDEEFSVFSETCGSYVKSLTYDCMSFYFSTSFGVLKMFSSLISLNLFNAEFMKDEHLMLVRELRTLRKFCLSKKYDESAFLTSIGFQNVFKEVIFPNLSEIYFENCDIDDVGVQCLVKSCPSLTILSLHGCKMVSEGELMKLRVSNPKITFTDRRQSAPTRNEFQLRF